MVAIASSWTGLNRKLLNNCTAGAPLAIADSPVRSQLAWLQFSDAGGDWLYTENGEMSLNIDVTRVAGAGSLRNSVAWILVLLCNSNFMGNVASAVERTMRIEAADKEQEDTGWKAKRTDGAMVLGPACVTAMAYSSKNKLLYAVDGASDGLIIIDESLCLRIRVGPLGFPVVTGLTVNASGEMFAVDGQADALLRVDVETGKATTVGPLGFSSVQSLACDRNNIVYGIDTDTDQLLQIDTLTGQATPISKVSAPSIFSLTFVEGQTLYGADIASSSLYRIDVKTGECARLTQPQNPLFEVHGMAACDQGRLLAYKARNDALCEVDAQQGSVTRTIQMRSHTVSKYVTQLLPDALLTRVMLGLSALAITVVMFIQSVKCIRNQIVRHLPQLLTGIARQNFSG